MSKWQAVLVCIATTLGMAALNTGIYWDQLHIVLYEAGDFAANSLLIQNAKTFDLLTGNYSRVGFNHPGPAILYVLATGEWLFHDALHWVSSPFAGQLLAVGFYNGFWLGLICIAACSIFEQMPRGLALATLLLALTVHVDSGILGGIWFPYLYYFPFLTFLLAIAGLCLGRWVMAPVIALSGGFLVHGHVSFVAITGIMLSGALLANFVLSRSSGMGVQSLFEKSALRSKPAAMGTALFFCLLFLLPIFLQTVKHYPGPIAQYISFGKSNPHHPWASAIGFVSGFWGRRWIPLLFGLAALAMAVSSVSKPSPSQRSRGAITCVSLTVALSAAAFLFYARVGIDNLEFQYVGIFFLASPVLALSVVFIVFFFERISIWLQATGLTLLACVLALGMDGFLDLPTYAGEFNRQQTPVLARKIASLDAQPVALDPDKSEQWNNLWSSLTAVAILEKREGKSTFCIARNWHILFTTSLRCTPEQSANRKHFGIYMPSDTPIFDVPEAERSGDFLLYKPGVLTLREGVHLTVGKHTDAFATSILGQGWAEPTGAFLWSTGDSPQLHLKLRTRSDKILTLDSEAILSASHPKQTIKVLADKQLIDTLTFELGQNRASRSVRIPVQAISPSGVLTITLQPAARYSPRQAGLSADSRLLGIGLHGIRIDSAPQLR